MSIELMWDEEERIWIAECEQIGLILEDDSYDLLLKKVKSALPEQLRLNGFIKSSQAIYADLAESRACYERGEFEDFDSALDDISEKYGV